MQTVETPVIGGRGDAAQACFGSATRALGASAELFGDVETSTMFPDERHVVRGATSARRREFASVRFCARLALRTLGWPAVPILPDADGAPRWPAGLVGSMTHCEGYRGAIVVREEDALGVGLDAEPHAPLSAETLDFILRDEERAHVASLEAERPDVHWSRLLFCAKEAVYKAVFPLTRRWLEFSDVAVCASPDGSFRARVVLGDRGSTDVAWDRLRGCWRVDRGFIVATTSLGPRQPRSGTALHAAT